MLDPKNWPIKATKDDPIPASIWPDLSGVLDAKQKEYANTLKDWRTFWALALKYTVVAIDTETNGLRPAHGDRLIGVSAAFFDGKLIHCGYWNFRHTGHKNYKETAVRLSLSALKTIDAVHQKCCIAGMNYKFDVKMLHADGVDLPVKVLDVMLIAHLYNENLRHYNLDTLSAEMGAHKLGDTIGAYLKQHGLDMDGHGHEQVPYELERPYAIADAVLTLKRLQWERQRWLQLADPRIMDVFQIEMAQTPAVAKMEIDGVKLDKKYVKAGIVILTAQAKDLETKIYALASKTFNIGSEDQLWALLEARGFKPVAMTEKGNIQLDDVALASYKDPFCELVREWRKRDKVLNTYFKPFVEKHMDKEDKIHPDYFVASTVSGRSSCREPNLQNAPNIGRFSDTGNAFETRRCFIPLSSDYSLMFFDEDQMEIKIFAEVSEEEYLLNALKAGMDLHEATARSLFPGFPSKDVDPQKYNELRDIAKRINFGIIYGMGRNKLALKLGIPVDETMRALLLAELCYKDLPNLVHDFCRWELPQIADAKETHRLNTALKNKGWDGLRALSKTVAENVDLHGLTKLLVTETKNAALTDSAESFLKKYHERLPKIKELTKNIRDTLASRGYIFNRYGRRYHLTKDQSYIGTNRWIQGTSADMFKLTVARVYELLKGRRTQFVNQVHDDLQFYMHHEELDLVPKIVECMTCFPQIKVQMSVTCKYSHVSWADKRPYTGITEFLNADTRPRTKAKLAALKKLYDYMPGKQVETIAEEQL